MPPNLASSSADPALRLPAAEPTSSDVALRPGVGGTWPTYELTEQDLGTFMAVPAALSGAGSPKLDRPQTRALLQPIVSGEAGYGGRFVAERRHFTVRRDGAPAGRLVAHLLAPHVGGPAVGARGFFGLLAAEPDTDAVRFLFDMASDWLGSRGCSSVIGNVRPDPDTGADAWIGGCIDPVAAGLGPCLAEVGLGTQVGASIYTCPIPTAEGLRNVVTERTPPDGVAWTPLHARAPWRGIQGILAGERIAVAECDPSAEPPEQAWRRFVGRIRGATPSGSVRLRRFRVHRRLRDRGVGSWMAHELFVALGRAGVTTLVTGPVHDAHVAARRLLHGASASRLERIPMFTRDI